jgi:hypothetical protein
MKQPWHWTKRGERVLIAAIFLSYLVGSALILHYRVR